MDKHPKHDWISEAIESIDKCLETPPLTIEESLRQAVERGTMSIKESQECLEAYLRTLGGQCLEPTDPDSS